MNNVQHLESSKKNLGLYSDVVLLNSVHNFLVLVVP